MHNWVILNNIIKSYDNKYEFIPTVDVQSFALSPNGIIVLDINKWRKPDLFFIFSVLHEIGHYFTRFDYDVDEDYILRRKASTMSEYILIPCERLATDWAIAWLHDLEHWVIAKQFEADFMGK
jgi:hypothetical protein